MNEEFVQKIKNDPNYKELLAKRTPYAVTMSIIVLLVYFSFIFLIAFAPDLLGVPISDGLKITTGVVVGFFMILFAFIMTAIYTIRANSEFDSLIEKIKESAKDY